MKKIGALPVAAILSMPLAYAHCPLCTIGAAAAAGGAAYLGVNQAAIGIFIGAFAVSTGWWFSNVLKRQFIPYQRTALIIASFLLTIIPMLPLMKGIAPFLVSLAGGYGTLLNRTYIINFFLFGSIIGGFIVCITPWLSQKFSLARRGKFIPFQGIAMTFGLLLIVAVILQVVM